MKKWKIVVATTVTVALTIGVIAGCGSSTVSPSAYLTFDTDRPVDGGALTLSMFTAPSGKYLPGVWDNEYDRWVSLFTYDTLFEYNKDLTFKSLLAQKWDLSSDKRTIIFYMNPNAKWSDGQAVTADDVAWTFNWLASKDYNDVIQGPYQMIVSYIEGFDEVSQGKAKTMSGIKVSDPHMIEITLAKPYAGALAIFGQGIQILPKHIWEHVPANQYKTAMQDPKNLIGDGPYVISKIVRGQSITLVKNPNYYGGKPHIDTIIWKVVNNHIAAGQMKNGEIDEVADIDPLDVPIYKSLSNVHIFEYPGLYYQYLGYKLNNPILKDKTVRQAIAYAIDRKGIIAGLLKGHGDVLNTPIYTTSWANPPAEQVNTYEYNPDKTKKMLDAAGYKVGANGFRTDKNGNPFELALAYPIGNKVREKSAPIIAKELQAVGLNVKLVAPKDFASFADEVKNDKDIDLWLMGWGGSIDPDQNGYWSKNSSYNYYHFDNPLEEALVTDAVSGKAFDPEYRKQVMWKWAKLMNDELPQLPLYGERNIFVWNTRLHGVQEFPTVGIFEDPQNWWLSK